MAVNNAVGEAFLPVPYLKFFAHKRSATDFPFLIFHFSFSQARCDLVRPPVSLSQAGCWLRMKNEK
jgi:hypothetical protein